MADDYLDWIDKIADSKPKTCNSKITLGKLIEKGSFGAVYEGEYSPDETSQSSKVAVKISRLPEISDPEYSLYLNAIKREMFISQYLANLSEKCPVVGVKETLKCGSLTGDSYYIVMDFIDGKDLFTVIRDQSRGGIYGNFIVNIKKKSERVMDDDAARIFLTISIKILEGVQCLHDNGVFHQDIKPANILLSGFEETFKVTYIDFGLSCVSGQNFSDPAAKKIAKKIELTCATQYGDKGTLPFMPPEIFKLILSKTIPKNPEVILKMKDTYSIGVTLFILWTGRQFPAIQFNGNVDEAFKMFGHLEDYSRHRPYIFEDVKNLGGIYSQSLGIIDGLSHYNIEKRISIKSAINSFKLLLKRVE